MTRSLWSRLIGRRTSASDEPWGLSTALLNLSGEDAWTIGDAVEGTLVLGATGSGKTSASGRAIATSMLGHGFGGLVLTAKADERANWERYCADTGRADDLIVFAPGGPWTFNFLDHERTRAGAGAGLTENIVNLLSTVLEVAERGSGAEGGRGDEGYWRRANRQLMRNAVDLLSLSGGRVTIPDLYRVVISAPTSTEQLRSEEWKANSFCFRCLAEADKRAKHPRQAADFAIVADYFVVEFPALSEKTRSVIVSTFTSMVDVLNRGVLREAFCGETTLTPEAVEGGKIIVIDFPVKNFAEVGLFAQAIMKYAFQRSIERRTVDAATRPVFLWADEAQNFLTSYDHMFQTTCRSARVATVLLSQNVSNFYAVLGGSEKGRSEAASLFANCNTKIFHANADPVTNEWAASVVGRTLQQFANGSSSSSPDDQWGNVTGVDWRGEGRKASAGFSESYDFDIQPAAFTTLRTGGAANKGCVDAIVVRNGRVFRETGKPWLPVTFQQQQ
jgi:hypothetical protein